MHTAGSAPRPIAVVMGVSGCGKTFVGTTLARALDVDFVDGDWLHPAANIAKMASGQPLDDADRWPWLDLVGSWLEGHRGVGGVATCSALKRAYRDRLRAACPDGLPFLHLAGAKSVAAERVAARPGHFMPASLIDSQYATLEPLGADEPGLTVDFAWPPEQIVDTFVAYLGRRG